MFAKCIFILVATTDCKIVQNPFFHQLKTNESLQLIISNQKIHLQENLVFNKPFTQIINTETKGISSNRNSLLKSIKDKTGIAIIADDDVEYVENFEEIIRRNYEENSSFDVLTFQIHTPENKPYKKYNAQPKELKNNSLWNRRQTLSMSSIEITFTIQKVVQSQVLFHEKIGIGSTNSVGGEEVFFLQDLLQKGLKIKYIPTYWVIHPLESSGKRYSLKLMESFALVFKRTYGVLAYPFLIYFVFKKRKILRKEGISLYIAIQKMFHAEISK